MRRLLILLAIGCTGTAEVADDYAQVVPAHLPTVFVSVEAAATDLASYLELPGHRLWSASLRTPHAELGAPEEPPEIPFPPQYGLASAVQVARVAIFQSVGIDLARDGVEVPRDVPLVAGRAARVRVYLGGGVGSAVLGRLRWQSQGVTTLFVWSMEVVGPSSDEDPASVFEFEVPKEFVREDAAFAVDILEDEGGPFDAPSDARFPMDGTFASLSPEPAMTVHLRIIPMRYDFDGSMRVPDVSTAQMSALRDHIEAAFPVVEADVEVVEPRAYGGPISPDDFDEHVDALHQVAAWRATDAAPNDVYYMGVVSPADSFGAYCSRGCYAGVAPLNETNTAFQRVALVVWYGASTSGWTALHELGHTHGRSHVDCGGATGLDPDYPYAGGEIGVWGLDQRTQTFLPPSSRDFMSYCGDEWVSDYSFRALAERVRSLRDAASIPLPSQHVLVQRQMVTLGADGPRWSTLGLPAGTLGEETTLLAIAADGSERFVRAERISYSIDGPRSYVLPIDDSIRFFIIDGVHVAVPRP